MEQIPLEDGFIDIINKAIRGTGISPERLAEEAKLDPQRLSKLLEGAVDEQCIGAVAPILGLDSTKLIHVARNEYNPATIVPIPGFQRFNTPFGDMTVNSYLVWDQSSHQAVAFDTGTDVSEMLDTIKNQRLTLELILLTHTHGDHVFDLDRLIEKTNAQAWVNNLELFENTDSFQSGHTFLLGNLRIETRHTWGHSPGGTTYVIHGLSQPLAIVGDALFAGSMGGGIVDYSKALETNRKEILTLPDNTILCPGHGPLTTVAEQKQWNPFF